MKIISFDNFELKCGKAINLKLSYQIFGVPLGDAPVILINHALTGNSNVLSWWGTLVGDNKLINTNSYTVICFNIPGNGFDGQLIDDYKLFSTYDVARLFLEGLNVLQVKNLYALIGGSLGGGIAWEMLAQNNHICSYLIPIASDWKASDWIIAQNHVQESVLLNSSDPVEDARKIAMLFYRSPLSFKLRFNRGLNEENEYQVISWLKYHGSKLKSRFNLKSYLLMNHLLANIKVDREKRFTHKILQTKAEIIQVCISSDLLFTPKNNYETKYVLDRLSIPNQLFEIQSNDGHDAFLIEFKQLEVFLSPIFKIHQNESSKVWREIVS